jgi:hypothetical protein
MGTTTKQDQAFRELVEEQISLTVLSSALEAAIEHIRDNFSPDEVFSEDALVEYVKDNKLPIDVFEEHTLESWAESNGYTKQ